MAPGSWSFERAKEQIWDTDSASGVQRILSSKFAIWLPQSGRCYLGTDGNYVANLSPEVGTRTRPKASARG